MMIKKKVVYLTFTEIIKKKNRKKDVASESHAGIKRNAETFILMKIMNGGNSTQQEEELVKEVSQEEEVNQTNEGIIIT